MLPLVALAFLLICYIIALEEVGLQGSVFFYQNRYFVSFTSIILLFIMDL